MCLKSGNKEMHPLRPSDNNFALRGSASLSEPNNSEPLTGTVKMVSLAVRASPARLFCKISILTMCFDKMHV